MGYIHRRCVLDELTVDSDNRGMDYIVDRHNKNRRIKRLPRQSGMNDIVDDQ